MTRRQISLAPTLFSPSLHQGSSHDDCRNPICNPSRNDEPFGAGLLEATDQGLGKRLNQGLCLFRFFGQLEHPVANRWTIGFSQMRQQLVPQAITLEVQRLIAGVDPE
jgi:hypothetical protein